MTIIHICTGCRAKYELEQHLAGRRMFCKRCHTVFTVGEAQPVEQSPTINHQANGRNGHTNGHTNGHNGRNGHNGKGAPNGAVSAVPREPQEQPGAKMAVSKRDQGSIDIHAVVQSVQDIVRLDLRTLRVTVAELMGYTEIMMDDGEEMQGILDGVMVRVPNYPIDPVHTNDLLMRLEWSGVPYALRYESEGAGDHYGFYLRGGQVLGPSRAIAICRGFLLAKLHKADAAMGAVKELAEDAGKKAPKAHI